MKSILAEPHIMIKQTLKASSFAGLVAGCATEAAIVVKREPNEFVRRKKLNVVMSKYAGFARGLLGIETRIVGKEKIVPNTLMVSNHLSYLDILSICAAKTGSFVTSVEMRDTPLLGFITKMGGCLYVERRNKNNLGNEINHLTEALKCGLDVIVFPEATSTNGDEVIRFRRPLFQAAVRANKMVQPFTLNYLELDGEKINIKNRDEVCWYGDMEFGGHFLNIMRKKRLVSEIIVHDPIEAPKVSDLSEASQILAEHCYKVISSHFKPCSTPEIVN